MKAMWVEGNDYYPPKLFPMKYKEHHTKAAKFKESKAVNNTKSTVCQECSKKESSKLENLEREKFLSSLRIKQSRLKRADSYDSAKISSILKEQEVLASVNVSQTQTRFDKLQKALSLGDLTKSNAKDALQKSAAAFEVLERQVIDSGGGHSYLYAPLLPTNQYLIEAAILAVWDNIVGPKASFVWTKLGADENSSLLEKSAKKNSNLNPPTSVHGIDIQTAVQYAVGHTLHGELDRKGNSGTVNTELYIVGDKGFALGTVTFGTAHHNQQELLSHSLSFIIPIGLLSKYLELNLFMTVWMERLAYRLKAFLFKWDHGEALTRASSSILEFAQILNSVVKCGLQKISKMETYLTPNTNFGPQFMEKAVASHLQTCGCSVVIGENADEINIMIRTLALFLKPSERSLVRIVKEKHHWPYSCGLLIQGLIGDGLGSFNIDTHEILHNYYPTTLINLINGQIIQSRLLPEHKKQHSSAIRADIERHLKNKFKNVVENPRSLTELNSNLGGVVLTSRSVFQPVTEIGFLVPAFFQELKFNCASCVPDWEEEAIAHFRRQLEYRSLALICYFNKAIEHNKYSVQTNTGSEGTSLKNLRKCLDLENEGDFRLILATAEKLHNGIYEMVMSMQLS